MITTIFKMWYTCCGNRWTQNYDEPSADFCPACHKEVEPYRFAELWQFIDTDRMAYSADVIEFPRSSK